jgi:hypothetical protein
VVRNGTAGDVTEDVESWTQVGWSAKATSRPNPGALPINPDDGWMATTRGWEVTFDVPALGGGWCGMERPVGRGEDRI